MSFFYLIENCFYVLKSLSKTQISVVYFLLKSKLHKNTKINLVLYLLTYLQTLNLFGFSKNNSNITIRKKSIKASKKLADELQFKLLIENKIDSKLTKLNELKPK